MNTDMEDISVHFVDFHGTSIDEQVILNQDGSYTILIDARASYEAQAEAYEHAMSHIRNMDFQKDVVQQIEAAAHRDEAQAPVITLGKVRVKAKKRASITDWDKIERKLRDMQYYCDMVDMDFYDYLFRRAEEKKLYGGM